MCLSCDSFLEIAAISLDIAREIEDLGPIIVPDAQTSFGELLSEFWVSFELETAHPDVVGHLDDGRRF